METIMNRNESILFEAVKNMLDDKAQLGLSIHNTEETSHNAQFHWEDIADKFRIKINNPKITMFDAISGAFYHTHSYKNIDDPQFDISFRKQLDGLSVPQVEQKLVLKYIEELRTELKAEVGGREDKLEHDEFTNSEEQSAGLQDQNEMAKVTNNEA